MNPTTDAQNECCCCSVMNCRGTKKTEYPKRKLLTRAIESFYDNCAAYNLRYIPYRTVADRETCMKNIAKDFVVLFCFLVTNFIVLLTILSRIAMHLSGVFSEAFGWLKQVTAEKKNPKPVLHMLYKEPESCISR